MKIVTVVGARPQFIKASALSPELERRGVDECIVHTGQHYDYGMSRIFFDELKLAEPRYSLDVGSASHAVQTAEIMKRLEPVLQREAPRFVLVYGDTNSTLAAALVASKLQQPLVHVEAGLRSFDRTMPEEVNRVVTDHLASLCFAPTSRAEQNLRLEGIVDNVRVVGDLMVDLALTTARNLAEHPEILNRLRIMPKEFAVATIHRAGNTDDPEVFAKILSGLGRLELPVILPAHPRIRQQLEQSHLRQPIQNLRICDPLSYTELIALQLHARVVITDSGGIQKEAYVLGTPCVTLRAETEWTETLTDGWNMLAGCDPHAIAAMATRELPRAPRQPFYGKGQAAAEIAGVLCENKSARQRSMVG